MGPKYDAVVAGGSIAGLTFASEAAKRGLKVLVCEEHDRVGEPEKCDGLVSLKGLSRYGYPPAKEVIQDQVAAAVIHSPSGRELPVSANSLEVVVIDRSEYDRQVAARAESWGAELRLGTRVAGVKESDGSVSVTAGTETIEASYHVDCTGPSSSPRSGIVPAAKYEVEGDWIRERVVEVFLDAERYPGFFAWVIPYGKGVAKVGAAGRGIDPFSVLDGFLADRSHRVTRKVAAPLYVGGPTRNFVSGRTIYVGESCGQVKPTTAGGIMTSVAGAVIAARWLSDAVRLSDPSQLRKYQPDWESRFLKEMKAMLRLRGAFEHLTNRDLDSIIAAVSSPKVQRRLSESDFDFHATSLMKALGVAGLARTFGVVVASEVRSMLRGG